MVTGLSVTLHATDLTEGTSSAIKLLPCDASQPVTHQERWSGTGMPRVAMGEGEEDDPEDFMLRGSMLRKLTGVIPEDEDPSTRHPSAPASWKELEVNCQKLDDAEIRITSLDLTCAVDEEENTPTSEAHPNSIRYSFEVHSSPASSHAGSSTYSRTLVRTQSAASISTLDGYLSRSASTESFQIQEKLEPACLKELRKHLARKGQMALTMLAGEDQHTGASYSVLESTATAATSAMNTSTHPYVPATSSTKKKAPTIQVRSAGDIVPSVPPQSLRVTRFSSCETTASSRWGGPTKGQDNETSLPEDPHRKVIDSRLALALIEAKMGSGVHRETPTKKSEYSSLVVPGARARPEARQRGVQGLFQSVKSKCGELFTSHRAGKTATSH